MSELTATQPPTLWQKLLEPHSSVADRGVRTRARVLAVVSLALLAISIVVSAFSLAAGGSTGLLAFGSIGLFAVTYALSRTPRPEIGGILLVFGQLAVNFIVLFTNRDNPATLTAALAFMPVPVIVATLVLNARSIIAASILTVAGLVAAVFVLPGMTPTQVAVPAIATTLIAVVASASAYLRERDINVIRQQADDLGRYSASLEAEVRNVITTAQVGQAITGTRDLNQLLNQVVNLIVERFEHIYHAQVFMVDDMRQYAVLRESTGEPGQKLLAREHKLAVGSQSVIGQVTAHGRPHVVSDTDTDPTHRRNELLPLTRSEMALPLIAGGQVIGALDIQSVKPTAFKESDLRVFQTMADQLAVAIENARLFERAQRDLQEIELLNRRLTGEGWRRFEASRAASAPIGFEANVAGISPVFDKDHPGDSTEPAEGKLSLPLLVRGESIGVLDVKSRSGKTPDPEMQSILEAVAERVALALDSTRLSEQALRQAEREQVLSRLSAELQATTDLDVILRIAAREASRALGTPRGFVHLTMEFGEATAEAKNESA